VSSIIGIEIAEEGLTVIVARLRFQRKSRGQKGANAKPSDDIGVSDKIVPKDTVNKVFLSN
jgi:hypothetical protein